MSTALPASLQSGGGQGETGGGGGVLITVTSTVVYGWGHNFHCISLLAMSKCTGPHRWRWREGFHSVTLMWKSEGARFTAGVKAKVARGQGISRERAEAQCILVSMLSLCVCVCVCACVTQDAHCQKPSQHVMDVFSQVLRNKGSENLAIT